MESENIWRWFTTSSRTSIDSCLHSKTMGIKDLLKALSSESTPKLITDFRGQRIAIDSSGWLHKGLFAAAEDIVDTGVDSELYFDFLLARARNFILNGKTYPVYVRCSARTHAHSRPHIGTVTD